MSIPHIAATVLMLMLPGNVCGHEIKNEGIVYTGQDVDKGNGGGQSEEVESNLEQPLVQCLELR
jgi:hypothetical protein